MAPKSELFILLTTILLSALIACCMAQTFQYSRGWVNGKQSEPTNSKPVERTDGIPDICKQFFLSEILAHSNPLSVHVIAHDQATNLQQLHSNSYQAPQIMHDSDLIPVAPYFIESSSQSANELNDLYIRNVKLTI